MELSKYEPLNPSHLKQIMSEVMMGHQYRILKIQKPSVIAKDQIETTKQKYKPFQITINSTLKDVKIKNKIVSKVKQQQINAKKQQKMRKIVNFQLLRRLNECVLGQVQMKIPPPFSVLDSKQQGDYLPDGVKKQYPHFSNTLKPTEIPQCLADKQGNKINKKPNQIGYMPRPMPTLKGQKQLKIFPPPPRSLFKKSQSTKSQPEHKQNTCNLNIKAINSRQENCVMKIKQVLKFPKLLFRYKNCQFIKIAEELEISECNTKLLYDLFQDYFSVEQKIFSRSEESKKKCLKNIKRELLKCLSKYRNDHYQKSVYVPLQEEFVNLRQIRDCLAKSKQEDMHSSSQSDA